MEILHADEFFDHTGMRQSVLPPVMACCTLGIYQLGEVCRVLDLFSLAVGSGVLSDDIATLKYPHAGQ